MWFCSLFFFCIPRPMFYLSAFYSLYSSIKPCFYYMRLWGFFSLYIRFIFLLLLPGSLWKRFFRWDMFFQFIFLSVGFCLPFCLLLTPQNHIDSFFDSHLEGREDYCRSLSLLRLHSYHHMTNGILNFTRCIAISFEHIRMKFEKPLSSSKTDIKGRYNHFQ